ncbi:excinuclease ABC subunit UvrC [Protaetiibacter sp. SSC-01]|uniref:excinuclease ABC subunit UvrC n=1 Tax=Protaetiibacter sp. SSC-01 TaxID=2759943 RepID=UPI001656EA0E|nr:excinuclease ABC subunit UvrC [Protaetiibacter sp. SSC-01]QNO36341.1 excinuclease ABC subunit UvrC [Protaetiibacter sp. SSC-01]
MAAAPRADVLPWRPKAGEIPTAPGVYRFSDSSGRILYVGKAVNLRQRLSNYFQPLRSLHERTRHMVLSASKVEWTVVSSDFEALQLEYTWIKEFAPPYNVKFRDDKSYPYMAVTLGDEAPRVMVTRNHRIPGARYFGPYPKVWAVRETIDLMIKAFPIRTCSDSSYKRAMQTGRPCFPGQIGRCGGPCSQKVTIEEHREIVDQFVAFMASHDRRVIGILQREMKDAADAFEYERAARIRDRIQALENVLEKSAVVLPDGTDLDVFGIEEDELAAAVQQFTVRGGRIRGVRSWVVDKELDISSGDLVESVLETAYETDVPPREIVVPVIPDDAGALELWLAGRRERGAVTLKTAQRGDKAAVLQTATLNAKQALALYKTRRTADYVARTQALTELQEALGLAEAPLRMECYDVSHLGGTNVVASMVVFEDGLPKKSDYRKFAVHDTVDDTESMAQVLRRRLSRLDEDDAPPAEEGVRQKRRFAYRPGLIIVDGGQPQVQAAAAVLEELGIDDIPLVGLAKRLEEVWLPDDEFPVILPRGSEALFLLQRIRDEAHRFAITFQRQKRRADIGTVLSEIPGLGPARSKELLRHFGSVRRLRAASLDEIAEVRGIGPQLAQSIATRLGAGQADAADQPEEQEDEA